MSATTDPINTPAFERCAGQRVASITFSDSTEEAVVKFDSGAILELGLSGDCCSTSYFTKDATKDAEELVGATIRSVEEVSENAGSGRNYADGAGEPERGDGAFKWHFLTFNTDRGHVTLDWRNDSNGYYDGELYAQFLLPAEHAAREEERKETARRETEWAANPQSRVVLMGASGGGLGFTASGFGPGDVVFESTTTKPEEK